MSLILSGTDGLSDVDGSAATPAIRGTDANTGIFFPAADTIGFSEGGAEAARFDSSGNFGLGVTPSAWSWRALQVGSFGGFFATNSAAYASYLGNNAYYDGSNWRYIASSGSVHYELAGGDRAHKWYNAASGTAGNAITFTQAMTLDASGQLGVGTTSPTAKVHSAISSTTLPSIIASNANDYDQFQIRQPTRGGNFGWSCSGATSQNYVVTDQQRSQVLEVHGTTNHVWYISNAEKMTLDTSGNLLVGTTSATGTLTVKGTSTARAGTVISLTDSSAGNLFKIANDGLITTGGAANPYGNTTATGANAVFAADGVFYRSTSALKYKQDIRDIELIDIAKFRPIRYKSKCNGDDQTLDHFGIVADEVDQAGIKELVSYGIDGQVEGFQYERLTVVLLKAIQEQQAIITTLTARITALESA